MADRITKRYEQRLQPHPCKQCGETTQRPKYCSRRCSDTSRPWKPRPNRANSNYGPVRVCAVCSAEFKRPNRKGRDAGLCCSRECGFTLIRWRGQQSRDVQRAKAEFARWARNAKRAAEEAERVKPCKQCRTCGTPVSKGQQRCGPCRSNARSATRSSEAYKASKRAAKARRRALERGIHAERFDPFDVLNRDGWRCHMCGVSTPKSLRGTYDDRAPELDHIVPLADGGTHTRLNTACSCRRCNGLKGATVKGQLRLGA